MAKTEHFDTGKLVVGDEYSRPEIAGLANVMPPVNSREWLGIREYENCIILFVTLNKSDFDPTQMYADYFSDDGQTLFWDSQNRNTQNTPFIKRITSHDKVVLFTRITNKYRGKTLPFVYVGELTAEEWNGDKPVSMSFNVDDHVINAPDKLRELYEWSPTQAGLRRPIEDSDSRKKRAEKKRSRSPNAGQGRQQDPKKRKAIEMRAMLIAKKHYESLEYNVVDTSANRPFDYECSLSGKIRRIEVKGTTQGPVSVTVTINEVESACDTNIPTDLFIVHGIKVRQESGEWLAEDGELKLITDWTPKEQDLKPIQFTYTLP